MASHPCFSVVKIDGKTETVKEVVKSGLTDEQAGALIKELSAQNPNEVYAMKLNVDNEGKDELW